MRALAVLSLFRRWVSDNERIALRVLTGVILVVAVMLPVFGSAHSVSLANRILIFGLLATSLNLLLRLLNLLSLGHAALLATGAYGVAIAQAQWGMNYWNAALIGLTAGLVMSLVLGLMITRATGVYFVMITVAQGMILWGVAQRWATLTGGDNGLRGIVRPPPFASSDHYYWFSLGVVSACLYLLYRFQRSTLALRMRGIADSEKRMTSLGYFAPWSRYLAFNIAGFFASIAGILYVGFNQFISPGTVHIRVSIEVVLMAILGGAGTFFGPFVGGALVLTARSVVVGFTPRWPIVLGAVFIVVVLFARDGVAGAIARYLRLVLPGNHSDSSTSGSLKASDSGGSRLPPNGVESNHRIVEAGVEAETTPIERQGE